MPPPAVALAGLRPSTLLPLRRSRPPSPLPCVVISGVAGLTSGSMAAEFLTWNLEPGDCLEILKGRKGPLTDFLTIRKSARSPFRQLLQVVLNLNSSPSPSVAAAVRVAEMVIKRHSRKIANSKKIGYWAYLFLVLYQYTILGRKEDRLLDLGGFTFARLVNFLPEPVMPK